MASPEAQLAEIERDRIAVYLKRGRPGWWYLPAIGLATALMMASYDLENRVVTVLLVLLYAGGVGALAGRELGAGGVVPRISAMPAQLRLPLVVYMVVALLWMGAAWYLAGAGYVTYTVAGIASGLFIWLGGWIVFRVTDARADRLAAELGIRR